MDVTFEFSIGDIVCYKQVNRDNDDIDLTGRISNSEIKYRVISRIYEEITPGGSGLKSYALRHMNTATPGSGEIYKFSEPELILYSTLASLRKLVGMDEIRLTDSKVDRHTPLADYYHQAADMQQMQINKTISLGNKK